METTIDRITSEVNKLPLRQKQLLLDRISQDVDEQIIEESLKRGNEIDDDPSILKPLSSLDNMLRDALDKHGIEHPEELKIK